jgi:hypothetical protein
MKFKSNALDHSARAPQVAGVLAYNQYDALFSTRSEAVVVVVVMDSGGRSDSTI